MVLIKKRFDTSEEYLKGKVVVFKDPRDPRQLACKRVAFTSKYSAAFNPVPRGRIYLLGDNFDNSLDSRNYGPTAIGLIEGVVMYRVSGFDAFISPLSFPR